jgi:predicted lipid-binding transport protein (Tim44 family)
MKHAVLAILVAILSFTFIVDDAHARRFGGGSSFGMKRSAPPASAPRQSNRPPQNNTNTPPKRSWMGPIAGLATGLGLAALFSHLGLGEEMANFVMLLLLIAAAVFIFKMLKRRSETPVRPLQYAGSPAPYSGNTNTNALPGASAAAATAATSTLNEEFDAEAFARQAKLNFIRLQTANDAGNLDDIREFTTPEVYAEISMQISERSGAAQQTDVVELNAEVVELVQEDGRYIVSVHFSGLLREEKDAAPAPFSEIWHLIKPVAGEEGWRIAGVQQLS